MERDLAGFPVLYAPKDMPIWEDDPEMMAALARAENIVSSIRRDSREGIVLPGGYEDGTGWKLELLSSGSRRQFDTNAIIDRYDNRIATSVLADFVMLGQQSVGSFALADNKTQIFALAIGTYLDTICEVFNIQAIPRLIDINGDHFKGITDYPRMVHGDIEEPDVTQFSTFLETMVGIGVITPDEQLEKEVRRIGHLPEKVETAPPDGVQPGEQDMAIDEQESKSIYKITSIVEKYQTGKITRAAASRLLESLSLDDKQAKFYLDEAEKTKKQAMKEEDKKDEKQAEEAKKSLGRFLSK